MFDIKTTITPTTIFAHISMGPTLITIYSVPNPGTKEFSDEFLHDFYETSIECASLELRAIRDAIAEEDK